VDFTLQLSDRTSQHNKGHRDPGARYRNCRHGSFFENLGMFNRHMFAVGNRDGFLKIYVDQQAEHPIGRNSTGLPYISAPAHRLKAHQAATRFIGCYSKEKMISVGDDHVISLYDLEKLKPEIVRQFQKAAVDICFEKTDSWNTTSLSKDGLLLLTDCDGRITMHTQSDLRKVISPQGLSCLSPSLSTSMEDSHDLPVCATWVDSRQFAAGFDNGTVALFDVRQMQKGLPVAVCPLKKDDRPNKLMRLSSQFGSPVCVLGHSVSFLSKDMKFMESVEIVSVGESGPDEKLYCVAEDIKRDSLLVAGTGQKLHLLKPRSKL
jgi:WD40 repeat protein